MSIIRALDLARARLSLTLLLSLLLLGTTVPVLAGGSAVANPGRPGSAGTSDSRAVAAEEPPPAPPGRSDDFARPPERCVLEPYAIKDPCRVTRFPGRPWVLLWGDSHALMYLTPIRTRAVRERVNLVLMMAGSCPVALPFRSKSRANGSCDAHNQRSLDYLRATARTHDRVKLIVGSFWSNYRRNWTLVQRERRTGQPSGVSRYHAGLAELAVKRSGAMFAAIGRTGVSTDVIAQAGTVPSNARPCPAGESPYLCDLPRSQAMPREHDNDRWLRARARQVRGGRIIDPSPAYCDARVCRARAGNVRTWYDDIHIGERRSRSMGRYFARSVRDAFRG